MKSSIFVQESNSPILLDLPKSLHCLFYNTILIISHMAEGIFTFHFHHKGTTTASQRSCHGTLIPVLNYSARVLVLAKGLTQKPAPPPPHPYRGPKRGCESPSPARLEGSGAGVHIGSASGAPAHPILREVNMEEGYHAFKDECKGNHPIFAKGPMLQLWGC